MVTFQEFPIKQAVAIIGGGIAGLMTSLELSSFFPVYLLEKRDSLGGNLLNVKKIFTNGKLLENPISNLINLINSKSNVKINLGAEIKDIEGNPGNYKIKFLVNEQLEEINVGVICISIGLSEMEVESNNSYKANVINQTSFSQLIKEGKIDGNDSHNSKKTLVFINDIKLLNDDHEITSPIMNIYSLVNAIEAKKRGHEVIYIYDNINTPFTFENLYRTARKLQIQFLKAPYEILKEEEKGEKSILKLKIEGKEIVLRPDYIILSNPLQSNDDDDLIELLTEVKKTDSGLFRTLYDKIYQNETSQKGIFLVGSCIHPMTFSQIINHSKAASLSVYKVLKNEVLRIESSWAEIIDEECIKCQNCVHSCPFNAINVLEFEDSEKIDIKINEIRCRGCGICTSVCPTNAIIIKTQLEEDIEKKIRLIIKDYKETENKDPKIIGYVCKNCASYSLDLSNLLDNFQHLHVSTIPISCAGSLSPLNILKPLALGADGVIILKCPQESCHFIDGSIKSDKMITFSKDLLKAINANSKRIEYLDVVSASYDKIKNKILSFIKELR